MQIGEVRGVMEDALRRAEVYRIVRVIAWEGNV